jgi:hypothetical protein
MMDVPLLCEFTVGIEYKKHNELRLSNIITETSLNCLTVHE